jgi:hypothetical protein
MTDTPTVPLPDPEPGQEPTGELPPGVTEADASALDELAAAGWGEGDDGDPHVPGDLLELHEAIEAREAGLL